MGTMHRLSESSLGRLRIAAGFSQAQAAQRLDIHQTVMSDWERGEFPPSIAQATALAKLYGRSLTVIQHAAAKDGRRYVRKLSAKRRAG